MLPYTEEFISYQQREAERDREKKRGFFLFSAIVEIWKENNPLEWCVFLPDVCQVRLR